MPSPTRASMPILRSKLPCARRSSNWSRGFRSTDKGRQTTEDGPRKTEEESWSVSIGPLSSVVYRLIGESYALSELRQPRHPGQGLATDRGQLSHPAATGLPCLQLSLHHVRACATARADRHQAQRSASAVRSGQASAIGADRVAQASG